MAKTRARSSKEAHSEQNDGPDVIDRKSSGSSNKGSIKSATTICKSNLKRRFQTKEPTRNVIDASRSLRRAKAMAIVKTIELQKPRSRPHSTTSNTIQVELVSSKRKQEDKVITGHSHAFKKHTESNNSPASVNSAKNESPTIRVTRSSISSSASSPVNKHNLSDADMSDKASSKNPDNRKPTCTKNDSPKDRRKPTSALKTPSSVSTSDARHSRVASLNARAKVHLLYDDGYTNSKQQQPNTSTPKINMKKPLVELGSTPYPTKSPDKIEDSVECKKMNVRELRSLPVRSANNSIAHQFESSLKLQKKKESTPTSNLQKNKRSSHDDIEIIDTKRCKRQANLNASAFMLATCTSDYIISSNGPPAALLRQESALKNLKEKKTQQNAKTCNTNINLDPPKKVVISSFKKSDKISSTSNTLINRQNPNASEGTSKLVGVKTYSKKDSGQSVKSGRSSEKNQEKKVANRTLGSISDAKDITLDERNSTHSDLIIDPISRICESIDTSMHMPKATQVRINTTEDIRPKGNIPSGSIVQVQEAIHSKEKHRIKIHRTKATTSQSYRVELQTTVSQPLSTFITSGHGTSAVFSNQASGTSSGGQSREGQGCHRRANDQVIQSAHQHMQNALQIAPGVSASSSRVYTGRSPVYNSNSTQIQDPCTHEASTSMGTNITSSLGRSLQHLNQPQMHNLERTYVDTPLNSNSIPMIDVADSSSSQLHQNAFIIPSVTPLQSPSSSMLSPSSSSPFFYGFYQQQNSAGQGQRTTNQYSQPLIQANKQHKTTGWTETYPTHTLPSPNHISNRSNLHIKASPVAGELFCATNRSFDQFGNLYNQSYNTNDSSIICTDPSNMRSSMTNQSQPQYQNTLERQRSNSPYYSYDNSGNQRNTGLSHMPRNSSRNSTYQISRPNPPASMNQSQTYQDTFMQTLGVPPLIGISEQPYLILYPRSNDVGFSVSNEPQNKAQDSYCNSHNLMIPSVTASTPVRPVKNGSSLISSISGMHDAVSGHSGSSSKKGSNRSHGVNVAKKSNKSQGTSQHDRRANKQTASSNSRVNREHNNSPGRTTQPSSDASEKAGLLAVAPFGDRIIEATNTTLATPSVNVSSQIASSSSVNHLKTQTNNFPSSTKPHGGPTVRSPISQNQQAITDTSNTSSPSESSDPSIRRAQKKVIKKRTLEGLWTLQGTPEEKFVNLTVSRIYNFYSLKDTNTLRI